jgi:hypothetical protein
MLARQFPALAPALTKLGEEHAVVALLQDEIQQLVDGYVPGGPLSAGALTRSRFVP